MGTKPEIGSLIPVISGKEDRLASCDYFYLFVSGMINKLFLPANTNPQNLFREGLLLIFRCFN